MNKATISITTGTFIRAILVVILFVALYYLRDIVLIVLTSIIIASAIEPATRWFVKYKIPRTIAVIMIYLLLLGFLVGLFYFFIPPLLNDFSGLVSSLPEIISDIPIPGLLEKASSSLGVTQLSQVSNYISLESIVTNVQNIISNTSKGFFATASLIFGGALSVMLMLVLSFYFSVQKDGIVNFLRVVVPAHKEEYVIDLWHRSQDKIGKWMQGQLILAAIIGILVYLGLTILGIKYALALALLAAVAELIPVFGPIIAAVPAVILAFLQGGIGLALGVLAFYVIIQQFENNLIYPLVVRKVVGVSPIMVILSLIIGAQLIGFWGIVLAVPIAAIILEFFDDIGREKERSRTIKSS